MARTLTSGDIAEFRDRLCEAGADICAERGFEGFKMRELAQRLGVSAMTPYRYFRDKEAIISEVRARAFARFADWLETRIALPDADETTLCRACAEYALREPSQYRLMFGIVGPASSMPTMQMAHEVRVHDLLAAHLKTLAGGGQLSGDPDRLCGLFWSVLHGTAALYMAGKLSSQDLCDVLADTVHLFAKSPAEDIYRPATAVYVNGHAVP